MEVEFHQPKQIAGQPMEVIFELTKISLAREAAVYNNLAPMESLCTHCKLASGAMSNGGDNAN